MASYAQHKRDHRSIFKWQLRRAVDAANHGDHQPLLTAFASPVEHLFFGQQALAGTRHGIASIVPW